MSWDTHNRPPIMVNAGETVAYDMTIMPKVPTAEKLKAARSLTASLPANPADRVAQILAEFRKLGHTLDETELWCSLMRELVAVGPHAVSPICEELDRTSDDVTLRQLAFALRAIGDARAVPALIRAAMRRIFTISTRATNPSGPHKFGETTMNELKQSSLAGPPRKALT